MSRVKSNYDGDLRRFVLPSEPKFADLVAQISSLYSLSDFIVKYRDDEGDFVTVSSDTELADAIAGTRDALLRLEILPSPFAHPPTAQAASAPATEPRSAPAAAAETVPEPSPRIGDAGNDINMEDTPEDSMENFAGFFENMFAPFAGGFGRGRRGGRWGGRGRGHWHRGGRRGHHGHRGRRHGREPFGNQFFDFNESDFSRFMSGFDPANMRSPFGDVSPEVVNALKNLMRQLMQSCDAPTLMATVPAAMPSVQAFLSSGPGRTGPVPQDAIDSFVGTLTAAIAPHVGVENAGSVAAFVRQALADEGVLALLRQVAGIGASFNPAGGSPEATRGMSTAPRFDVHEGVVCDGCSRDPVVGTRHWCTTRPNFDLCDSCMVDPNVDKTGLEFRSIEFPWQADGSNRKVPRPTLVFGSRGVEVMMLQKILTDLGFMTPDMYRRRVGMYGPNTAQAVNSFRENYGLGTQGQYGVYDDIVAASLLSVLESNVPPVAASGADSSSSAPPAPATDRPAAA